MPTSFATRHAQLVWRLSAPVLQRPNLIKLSTRPENLLTLENDNGKFSIVPICNAKFSRCSKKIKNLVGLVKIHLSAYELEILSTLVEKNLNDGCRVNSSTETEARFKKEETLALMLKKFSVALEPFTGEH